MADCPTFRASWSVEVPHVALLEPIPRELPACERYRRFSIRRAGISIELFCLPYHHPRSLRVGRR
jgi:hypothetical protein